MKIISESYKKRLLELSGADKKDKDEEIHLPELTMKKSELKKYLKEVYKIEIK